MYKHACEGMYICGSGVGKGSHTGAYSYTYLYTYIHVCYIHVANRYVSIYIVCSENTS